MKIKLIDISFNIVFPIAAGITIYFFKNTLQPGFVKNYLADGLWAYSFLSSVLIIWNRKLNVAWIITAVVVAVVFEGLQYLKIISGTADLMDVVVYLFFFLICVTSNVYFATFYKKYNL